MAAANAADCLELPAVKRNGMPFPRAKCRSRSLLLPFPVSQVTILVLPVRIYNSYYYSFDVTLITPPNSKTV